MVRKKGFRCCYEKSNRQDRLVRKIMIYEIEGRKQFSYRLRQALMRIGMKHKELAAAIGMDVHHMSNILCGRRTPHVITLQKILIAIPNVDARWLIVGELKPELEISLAPQE